MRVAGQTCSTPSRRYRLATLSLSTVATALALVACTADPPAATTSPSAAVVEAPTTAAPTITTTTTTTTTTLPDGVTEPPAWLGTRELPLRADGFGVAQPTPPELADRRFTSPDILPPPVGSWFESSVGPIPSPVLARSTWHDGCPVHVDDLAYLTMSFWGFDERPHTGEMIVAASVADDVVDVFRSLFEARYPIEEMRVRSASDLEAPPTGDGNITTGFECRDIVGSSTWSQHAYGLAIDVNPFHNPYQRGDRVIPELAEAYLIRDDRPGIIHPGDTVVEAFAAIGWSWGGDWISLVDYMHFSATGR